MLYFLLMLSFVYVDGQLQIKSTVLVFVRMLAARVIGALTIVTVNVDDRRLSIAKEVGTHDIIKASTTYICTLKLHRRGMPK
ncbi:putative oxidoreductase [Helianthus anomalus]